MREEGRGGGGAIFLVVALVLLLVVGSVAFWVAQRQRSAARRAEFESRMKMLSQIRIEMSQPEEPAEDGEGAEEPAPPIDIEAWRERLEELDKAAVWKLGQKRFGWRDVDLEETTVEELRSWFLEDLAWSEIGDRGYGEDGGLERADDGD